MPKRIESVDDPRLDGYRNLTDATARRSFEAERGLFVLEGGRVVSTALAAGWELRSLLVLPSALRRMGEEARQVESLGGVVLVADHPVIAAVAGFDVHRGVLALASRPLDVNAEDLLRGSASAVVVEGVNDHENLGSIFRNSAAFGVGAILLDPTSCDPLYRRSIRVSMGHVLRMPFARLTPWPTGLARLADAGFSVVALSPGASATLREVAARLSAGALGRRVAVVVGAEGPGLSEGALASAELQARIPMAAGVDSLNAATALAVALHTLVPPG
jgi:tRNA G18 (ribose-2'-O)-methylase SpoU